jgi:hypothetical protein
MFLSRAAVAEALSHMKTAFTRNSGSSPTYHFTEKSWSANLQVLSGPYTHYQYFPAHDGALCLELLAASLGIIMTWIQIWMSRRQQSVYCQSFAEYVLYGSHWETCCVSYGTVMHEVITLFFLHPVILWRILPELTKPSSRNLLFLWKIQALLIIYACLTHQTTLNLSFIIFPLFCVSFFYMMPMMQNVFMKLGQQFFSWHIHKHSLFICSAYLTCTDNLLCVRNYPWLGWLSHVPALIKTGFTQ